MKRQDLQKLLFAIMLVMSFTSLRAQMTLTVSDGTNTNNYVPVWGNWMDDTQQTQILYEAKDLVTLIGAQIKSITFYTTDNTTEWSSNTTWSMGTSDQTEFTSEFINGLTVVRTEKPAVNPTNNQLIITFDHPYIYNGGNLIIEFKSSTKGGSNNIYFNGTNKDKNLACYKRSGGSFSTAKFSPKITFEYTPGELDDYGMIISPKEISFPITIAGSEKTASFKVTNTGKNPIKITSINATAPFSMDYPTTDIASLESADLTVKFNPTEGGTFNQTPTITTSASGISPQITLSGEGLVIGENYYKEEFKNLTTDNLLPKSWGCNESSISSFSIYDASTNKGIAYKSSNSSTLLVSPCVKGEIIAFIKKTSSSSSASVKFFTCTQSGTSFKKGEEITAEISPALNENDWSVAKFNVAEGTFVGIQLSYTAIDMFAAAEVVPVKSIALIESAKIPTEIIANANYIATIPLEFTVKNTGTIDVVGSEYNFSISDNNKNTIGSINGVDIKAGESATVKGTVNFTLILKEDATKLWTNFNVSETLSETSISSNWLDIYPYVPILSIVSESGPAIKMPINLEVFKGDRNTTVYLKNSGHAPLTISQITPIEGISYVLKKANSSGQYADTPALPFELAIDEKAQMTINITTAGSYNGNIIAISNNSKEAITNISMEATLLADDIWFEDFEQYNTNDIPTGWVIEGSNWEVSERGASSRPESTTYNKRCLENGNVDLSRAISPKVKIEEGAALTFWATGRSTYSSLELFYSKDRVNWTKVHSYTTDNTDESLKLPYPPNYSQKPEFKSFTVNNIPEGEYYLAFDAGYAFLDNVYGYKLAVVEHDFYINSFEVDKKVMVNYPLNVLLVATNMLSKDETTNSYSVKLYEDEILVKEASTTEWKGNTKQEFTLTYTPHKDGEHKLKAIISVGSYSVETTEQIINVNKESAEKEVIVGSRKKIGDTDRSVPVALNSKVSRSETVYSKEELTNLSANNIIKKIAFPYYRTNTSTPEPVKVTIWLENTTENMSTTSSPVFKDITSMTKYYENENYTFESAGTSSDLILAEFILDKDFTYSGNNIRVIIQAEGVNTQSGYYFAFETKTSSETRNATTIYKSGDNVAALTSPTYFETHTEADWYEGTEESFVTKMPIIHFYIQQAVPALTGTVTEKTSGAILADAKVTLTSGEVNYQTATDANGAYSIDVFQGNKEYELSVKEDDFADYSENISVKEENITKDIQLDFTAMENAKVVGTNTISEALASESLLALVGKWTAEDISQLTTALKESATITGIYMGMIPTEAPATAFDKINPNTLLYVKEDAEVPSKWKNVVKGDKAALITLSGNTAFAPAKTFTAEQISYNRPAQMPTVITDETLCIPFDISPIPDQYTLKAFTSHNKDLVTFTQVNSIEANVPYIITRSADMALTLEASNVIIDKTVPEAVTQDGFTFIGTYSPIDNTAGTYYALDENKFKPTITEIPAFQAYFDGVTGYEALKIDNGVGIDKEQMKEMIISSPSHGTIIISTPIAQAIKVYSMDGRLIRDIELTEGVNTVNGLASGIYFVHNQKIAVR